MAAIKPAKKTNKIIRIKSKLKINEALVVCNVKILWVKILNSKKPIKIPKIIPIKTTRIPSRTIILKILFLEKPTALKTAKSPIRFSKLLANPEKILSEAIKIKIRESIAKLFEPIPNNEIRRLISRAGFAACKELSLLIDRGKLIFAIGDLVFINKAVISEEPNSLILLVSLSFFECLWWFSSSLLCFPLSWLCS